MYNRRLVNKYDEDDYFVIVIKTDNTGVGSTASNAFALSGAIGRYRVEAKNLSTNNTQRFGTINGATTLTFSEGVGTYELKIKPRKVSPLSRVLFTTFNDRLKVLEIKQWGKITWTEGTRFAECSNLNITATDTPTFTAGMTLNFFFQNCVSLVYNDSINSWDVSGITSATDMFNGATSFNQPLDNWDVSNMTNMNDMFNGASSFNQNINSWDVSSVTDMGSIFSAALAFNQPLDNWDVSNVVNMTGVFNNASIFNQDISSWDVSSVTTMTGMFRDASFFNQDISSWNVSSVTDMSAMFRTAVAFNQNINSWDVSSVLSMNAMFRNATSFNQNINSWDVSSVTNMNDMFRNASAFNQPLDNWDISSVTSITMFMEGKTAANYSSSNLNGIYNGWSLLSLHPNLNINFGSITYTAAGSAGKNILLSPPNSWTISDGGLV